ncbi:hypothetical protein BEK98_44920 [Streptomyces diastatochromogenes]|uniref:Diacylglycerol O-acyltransferase n=1 Tax=Streptomyces diastatochromogenes TaxID=42236 RepID=A0A233RRV2_STRDA|nr:hypothetical protein BEK98_44920 [Streptomyces diastatochromogenes]
MNRLWREHEERFPDNMGDLGGTAVIDGAAPPAHTVAETVRELLSRARKWEAAIGVEPTEPGCVLDFDPALQMHVHMAQPGEERDTVIQRLTELPLRQDASWGIWIAHGYAPDEHLLHVRARHSFLDGTGLLGLLEMLGSAGVPRMSFTMSGLSEATSWSSAVRTLFGNLRHHVLPDYLSTSHPSPLPKGDSGPRRAYSAAVPARLLDEIGWARDGTGHDAFLAATAGALRTWCEKEQRLPSQPAPRRPASMHALVPVSLRRRGDHPWLGCYLTSTRVPLPYGDEDSARRLDTIVAANRRLSSPAYRKLIRRGVELSPHLLMRPLFRRWVNDHRALQTQYLVRRNGPLRLAWGNAHVLIPFVRFLRGDPLGVICLRDDDTACVTFYATGNVPHAPQFPKWWADEVHSLHRLLAAPAGPRGCSAIHADAR